MLGQFSYRGGKDLDTGQKTVSPLRAFPFSFFFSPLFFFFFFCRAASRAQRTLSFRFRFPGKFSAPILPPLRSAPNRVIKIRPPSFIHRYSSPLLSFVPLRITARFPSLLRHSSSRWFDHILRKRRDRDSSFSQKGMKNLWNEARQGRGVYWPTCSV